MWWQLKVSHNTHTSISNSSIFFWLFFPHSGYFTWTRRKCICHFTSQIKNVFNFFPLLHLFMSVSAHFTFSLRYIVLYFILWTLCSIFINLPPFSPQPFIFSVRPPFNFTQFKCTASFPSSCPPSKLQIATAPTARGAPQCHQIRLGGLTGGERCCVETTDQ